MVWFFLQKLCIEPFLILFCDLNNIYFLKIQYLEKVEYDSDNDTISLVLELDDTDDLDDDSVIDF